MGYNLDDMIKESGETKEQIADAVKEMDQEAWKVQREYQDQVCVKYAREYGARTANEWERQDFQCFIDKAPELGKLTTGELRALFLTFVYDPAYGDRLYMRVPSFRVWRANRKKNIPNYQLAMAGKFVIAEAQKLDNIWNNL